MALRLDSVSRRFGRSEALDGLSLEVRTGDCYGFIGPNGAGKTTAMRVALGLHRPDRGRVLLDGLDLVRHPREVRARIGALIDVPGFHDSWSGRANLVRLAELGGLAGRAGVDEAERCLAEVGLAGAGDKPVRGYSHGMRQRLGLAQALLGRPDLLLLDEPTNGLDPEGIALVRELLVRLVRDHGVSVLVSSHQLSELAGSCNRIGVLKDGRLVVEEETAQLLGGGAARYRIESRDPERAGAVFSELGVEPERDGGGAWLADLEGRDPATVARALALGGAGLTWFAPSPATLEEIYLRYARDGAAGARRAAIPAADERAERASGAFLRRPAPPRPITRVLRYELRRLTSGAGVPLLLLLPAIAAALAVLHRRSEALEHAREVGLGTLATTTDVTAFEGVGVGLRAGLPIAGLLVLGLASQSVAGELARGTLRNVLVRSVTRLDVALGKGLAAALATVACYACLAAAACAAAALAFDFGDVVEILPNGAAFPLVRAEELWPELGRALVSPLLPLCALSALGFAAGTLARTSAGAIGLALSLGIGLDLARTLLRGLDLEALSPTAYLPSPLGDRSFLRTYVDLAQGVSNAVFELGRASELVPLLWMLGALALGAWALARRSVP